MDYNHDLGTKANIVLLINELKEELATLRKKIDALKPAPTKAPTKSK